MTTSTAAAAAAFLRHIPQPHSSKQLTIIKPPGEIWLCKFTTTETGI
jgi:hypothetical protein